MTRRVFGVLLGVLLPAVIAAAAQRPAGTPTVAVLAPGNPAGSGTGEARMLDAFRMGLREQGYVEGQNVRLEIRHAEWKAERLPALAAELIGLRPDVLFTWTQPAAVAAKQATSMIPIVIGAAGDLVGIGVVASLARPGGNVTGMNMLGVEMEGKRLEMLKEAAPRVSHVAVLVDPTLPGAKDYPDGFAATGRALGLRLLRVDAGRPSDLDTALAAAVRQRVHALLMQDSAMFNALQGRVAGWALQHRVPSISRSIQFAEAGGLLQYGEDPSAMSRHAAGHVARILRGAKPADLPVEQPTIFRLVVNRRTAKALGLEIPPAILARADQVID